MSSEWVGYVGFIPALKREAFSLILRNRDFGRACICLNYRTDI